MMNGSKPYSPSGGVRNASVYFPLTPSLPWGEGESPPGCPRTRRGSTCQSTGNRSPLSLRACLKIGFGVPPLGGTAPEPPKGGTPNLRLRISVGFFRRVSVLTIYTFSTSHNRPACQTSAPPRLLGS